MILNKASNSKRGQHQKYTPYAFTEQGVAMLSCVLRSPQAVQVSVEIMRTFVRLRQFAQDAIQFRLDTEKVGDGFSVS